MLRSTIPIEQEKGGLSHSSLVSSPLNFSSENKREQEAKAKLQIPQEFRRMASSGFGLREEQINKACLLAMKAHKSQEKLYLLDKSSKTDVIFSFAGTWSVNEWFTTNPFGEKKINRDQFPSLRSIGYDDVAKVNEAFLNRFLTILPHIWKEVILITDHLSTNSF